MSVNNSDYERILLVKPEVFVYRIPVRTTNRAYRYFLTQNNILVCKFKLFVLKHKFYIF